MLTVRCGCYIIPPSGGFSADPPKPAKSVYRPSAAGMPDRPSPNGGTLILREMLLGTSAQMTPLGRVKGYDSEHQDGPRI